MPHAERSIKGVYQQQEILDAILICNINKMLNLYIFFKSHDFSGCFTNISDILNNGD